mmetsp:Transcript_28809/g.52624  ORF Transcript_28809/g.52624 Transcript_28809/m.52624 type:complete len:439 (+) Transcript_28809:62-1378(+)
MVVIINKSVVTDNLIKNKDARSESVDSFSSTIDVHHHKDAPFKKHPANVNVNVNVNDDEDAYSSPPSASVSVSPPRRQFDLAIKDVVSKEIQQHNADALSSILVLDSPSRPAVRTLLETYNGHLTDVGPHMLEGLRNASPSRLAARVGDYNENLFYEMRDGDMDVASIISQGSISGGSGGDGRCDDDCGSSEEEKSTSSSSSSAHLDSQIRNDIASFEDSIRESLQCTQVKYRGSFMQTERTMYQPAHVDYDYPILQEYGKRLFLAFFPLTEEGAFLQLWQDDYDDPTTATASTEDEEVRSKKYEGKKTATIIQEGTVVYIPRGKMFIVPSDTIHGGGFKRGHGGNLRFHLYIDVEDDANKDSSSSSSIEGGAALIEEDDDDVDNDGAQRKKKETNDIALLDHPMNKYTERHDRRRELCERFVDAEGLEGLLGTFFDI